MPYREGLASLNLRAAARRSPNATNGARHRFWRTVADWWSFQMATVECWLDRRPESPETRAIRLEGERIRKAFPTFDFDRPSGTQLKSKSD